MVKMPPHMPGPGRFLSEKMVATYAEDLSSTGIGLLLLPTVWIETPGRVATLSSWVGFSDESGIIAQLNFNFKFNTSDRSAHEDWNNIRATDLPTEKTLQT